MNTQALKKCLAELEKETPNLFYIKGILETVVDSNEIGISALKYVEPVSGALVPPNSFMANNNELIDEEAGYSDAYKVGPIAPLL